MVKYPHVSVKLVGEDGNAFAILGRVTKAMRKAQVDPTEIKAFQNEATSGDYDHLLATVMRWVEAELMTNVVKHARLETRASRARLKRGRQSHWQSIVPAKNTWATNVGPGSRTAAGFGATGSAPRRGAANTITAAIRLPRSAVPMILHKRTAARCCPTRKRWPPRGQR